MEDIYESNQSNIRELRNKSSYNDTEFRPRKKVFGGYSTKDTDEYIRVLQEQLQRAESAYNERIEEYSTFCEMQSKEKDNLTSEVESLKKEIESLLDLKRENEKINDELKSKQLIVEELNNKLSEKAKAKEEDLIQIKENNLLKTEVSKLYSERDKIAGENASLKKQLDLLKTKAESLEKDNKIQSESIASLSAKMRINEMQKNLRVSEYTQKEEYVIGKASQCIKELYVLLDEMKNDLTELGENLK